MRHVFLSDEPALRARWVEAFPGAVLSAGSPAADAVEVLWLVLPPEGDTATLVASARKAAGGRPVVALADVPSDEQGIQALNGGAAGYCNSHALAEVLQAVAATVLNGGTWVGQSLMRRLVSGVALATPSTPPVVYISWKTLLTEREIEVVLALSRGATNKEIARELDISERTVKAHFSSIFEKLKVRDRLQLTLRINGRG